MRPATSRTPEPFILLQTTRLQALFDPATGFLRRVRSGSDDILLAIYGAVRDQDWNTMLPAISDLSLRTAPDEFELRFKADCQGAHFVWEGMIRGAGDELEFSFDGVAHSEFYRNRIGLCVLHSSVQCAGKPCRILKADGSIEEAGFPSLIAPHQPFKQIKGMVWNPGPGIEATLGFEGDIFETEDQRNWTDASFKTYSTPLEIPIPVKIEPGARVRQRVLLKATASDGLKAEPRSEVVRCSVSAPMARPPVGLGLARGSDSLSNEAAGRLRRLKLSHLRVDLYPGQDGWLKEWENAAAQAGSIGAALHCALFVENEAGLDAFAAHAHESTVPIKLLLIFDLDEGSPPIDLLSAAQEKLGKIAPVAIGTNANFAELNRNRPAEGALVCFPINPQCHAFDDMSIMENLEAQQETVRTARNFGCAQVAISAIRLRARMADPRQRTLFGAAWTIGSLARLAPEPGIHSLTYYELAGVVELETTFPSYHPFLDLADFPEVLAMEPGDSSCIAALMLAKPGCERRILVANLTPKPRSVSLVIEGTAARVRYLDQTTIEEAACSPERFGALPGERVAAMNGSLQIVLQAYGTARVDLES